MAGMGPPPKAQKLGRNKTELDKAAEAYKRTQGDGRSGRELQAPELPNPKRWLKDTVGWWEAWTRSRQTAVFEPSDWETLKALLPIVDAMNREKDPIRRMKLFEAVHKAEKALGGTHIERLKGRIDVRDEVPGEAVAQAERTGGAPDGVAVLDEYRDLAN